MHVSAEAVVIQNVFCFLVESMVLLLLYKYTETINVLLSVHTTDNMPDKCYLQHINVCYISTVNSKIYSYTLKNSIKQSTSWEANSHPPSYEMFCLLWKHNNYYVHNSPLLVPIPSHMTAVHTLTACFFTFHFNIIQSPLQVSPVVSSGLTTKIMHAFLSSPMHASCLTHIIFLHFITPTVFLVKYELWSSLIHQSWSLRTTPCRFSTVAYSLRS